MVFGAVPQVALASVSAVAPVTLHAPELATSVRPAGSGSVIFTAVAVLLPVLVYVNVYEYGPLPAAPELALTALVRLMTALAVTVEVSVLVAVCAAVNVLVVVTVSAFVWPEVALVGTVAATMNLKEAPAASAPLEVSGAPVG